MSSPEKRQHKNNLRRQQRDEIRQALLIYEYIKVKQPEAYEEAAKFYNYLNEYYPCKKDLRKTDEFKAIKAGFTTVEKNGTRVYFKQIYQSISMDNPYIFTLDAQQIEPVQPEEATHPKGVQPEEATQPEGEQAEPEAAKPKKIMQLKIPLMKPAVFTQTISHITEETIEENPPQPTLNEENPLQTAYDEVLAEPELHPSLNEEIPEEIIEKILTELRQDPELHDVMEEIEQQVEVEQLDMDVDISDDERLEQELNWEFW